MKKLVRLGAVALIVGLVAMSLRPLATNAQEPGGGLLIEPTFGSGPNTLSPLFCNDTTCTKLVGLMFPLFIGVDAKTQYFAKGVPNGLALDWSASEDGKTYTFKLRTDMNWSDGTPVTADDVLFGYQVISNPDAQSPLISGITDITNVEAPDKETVVVTLKTAACTALNQAGTIPVAPKHVLGNIEISKLKDDPFSTAPTVTAGPYKFGEFRASDQTTLIADPTYVDLEEGQINSGGFLQPVVPDQTILVQQYLAGEVNLIDDPAVSRRAELRQDASAGNSKIFDYPSARWDYIALNLADPTDPQSGQDADGKTIEQKPHPIFGDQRVRKALALAIDVDAVIKGAVFGEGTRMASSNIPSSWAFDASIKPIAFDQKAAAELLDAAGWPLGADGKRAAKGAMYAPDGTPFKFSLLTNQGNTRREAIGVITKDALSQLGIEVEFQAIDFNVLNETVRSQKFDARIGGWQQGFPDDPDNTSIFLPEADIPGSGNNWVSYSNPKVTDLMRQALLVPGCKLEDRAKLYKEIQQIMAEDLPYIWLYTLNGWYGARSDVNGFDPAPNLMYNRIETWKVEAQ
jgi:peptide/nickel transport system substrate-binding protein